MCQHAVLKKIKAVSAKWFTNDNGKSRPYIKLYND